MPEILASGLALVAMSLMPGGAAGDAEAALQCRVPATLPLPHAERPPSPDDVRQMPVVGYTLALSWTPQYCGNTSARSMQCDKRNGHFGFILHGLWPEGEGRKWPQYCRPASVLPRAVIAENFCTTPSPQLMQHEWSKHGTCMAKDPDAYFDQARRLFQGITIPDMAHWAGQDNMTAGQLAGAFARANPRITIDMIRVQANRYGMLREVWICLDRRFEPAKCPAGKSGLARNSRIRIRTRY